MEFSTLIDRSAKSKTLVTTRIRGLLSAAEQVEVGLPSEADAVKLLLASAGLTSSDSAPPKEAYEIVKLCGSLPLAIAVAGKFLADLVDGHSVGEWTGLPELLRTEMSRGSEADGETSLEYRVIGASLRAVPEQDKEAVTAIFTVFSVVAEDEYRHLFRPCS